MVRCLSISNIKHFMGEKKIPILNLWVADRLFQNSRPQAFLHIWRQYHKALVFTSTTLFGFTRLYLIWLCYPYSVESGAVYGDISL